MKQNKTESTYKWKTLKTFYNHKTPWVEFIGEYCLDEQQNELEYYTVQRADSIIIIPLINNHIIKPQEYYRHGIKTITLDFPGGRFEENQEMMTTAKNILKRELLINENEIKSMTLMNPKGWFVDSSFSSQKLFTMCANLEPKKKDNFELIPLKQKELNQLSNELDCLQCKAALNHFINEFWNQ